jgi:hypothetical protein
MVDDRPSSLRDQLRARLRVAMKDGDQAAVSALRGALAAIDDAGAAGIAPPELSREESPIAGSRRRIVSDPTAVRCRADEELAHS